MYHCHIQVISRSSGRSSVAAAAYRSGTRIADERTGAVHDYTRKGGVVHTEVVLPDGAPARWRDRETLWNDVERSERSANAQLAREVEYALPRELGRDEQIALAREYARAFAREGMAADLSLHDKGDGNPHVHMMLTMRPCDADGFAAKSVNEYLVRNPNGEECHMTAAELEDAGGTWQKVYRYRGGRKFTKAEAEAAGLHPTKDRKGKAPIQRKHDLTDWNDKEKVVEWRERLATITNEHLEAAGSRARVDHRSNAERGIGRLPTLHEGYAVRRAEAAAMAEAGTEGREYFPVTGRRRENTIIVSINRRLREMAEKMKRSFTDFRRRLAPAGMRRGDTARDRAQRSRRGARRQAGGGHDGMGR